MAFNERLEIVRNANDEQLDLNGMAELLDDVEVQT